MDVEETAFFQCNGVVLTLWARDKLAADMGVADDGARWGGVALAHNVGSDAEVDQIVAEARAIGAEVTREPAPTFYGGYAGAFRDLDGHVWEVAHNPGFGLPRTGDGAPRRLTALAVSPPRPPPLAAASSGLGDHRPHLVGAEAPHRGRAEVPLRAQHEQRGRERLGIRRLDDADQVVLDRSSSRCP